MKQFMLAALIAAVMVGLPAADAEAKRLSSGGMKRSVPTQDAGKPAPQQAAPAPQQAAPAAPANAAAGQAAAPKRSWMGPIAGLAAGLGIAALASHFGLGGALANIMTMVLIGVVLMLVVGFVMRRFAKAKAQPGLQFAGAGAPYTAPAAQPLMPAGGAAVGAAGGATGGAAAAANDGFDNAGFEQIAKRVFIRLQAANDAGDQADLRRFTTPEMYGAIQQELLDRKGAAQRTEVLQLDASVVDRAEERGEHIVSVRFWGLIREESEAAATPFDEIWHLVRPVDGSRDWAIAGIQQNQ